MNAARQSQMLDLVAVTAFGLESVAQRELHTLGFEDAKPFGTGRVGFTGGLEAICRANLHLRSAERVLVRVGSFPASDFGALFEGVRALPLEQWIGHEAAFPVSGRCVRSVLSSVPAVQRATKKAIVERLMEAHGVERLPETGPTYAVEVSLLHDEATLTIDTSGAGLHKRGYRTSVGEAQLRETMAAGLVLLSFWHPGRPFMDPFCGTGTIAIEAAMIGRNIAPGLRRSFASEAWPQVPSAAWREAREQAQAAILPAIEHRLVATDIDERALSQARHHAQNAGVEPDIHFQQRAFEEVRSRVGYGCLITNPPWGERLGDREQLEELYRSFPLVLRRLETWSHFILTGYPDFERLIGQEATRRRKLYHANIQTTYYQFHGPAPGGAEGPREKAPVFGGLNEKAERQAEMFATVLGKHARHLRKWPERGITCYRLYERDIPEVPLVVDVYEGHLHVAEYERPHERTPAQHADWLDRMMDTACRTLGIERDKAFLKSRGRRRGLSQYERVSDAGYTVVVGEQGLRFEVNLSDYVDTGLFLDHRITRAMVRERARGKRFLNLFSYSGAFTVYAASGGAQHTTTVDLSATYLDWAERNLLLNGFDDERHELVQADAMSFIESLGPGEKFDLMVIDPPTYSNSKRTEEDWDVQARHTELLFAAGEHLEQGGLIYFSTNFRKFKPAFPESLVTREISHQTVPADFRNKKIHRCWVLSRG
ncbi:MAG: bifunctional 23S rRNA (guanine(2069)-N(7))-methyltransferase RlmK/23S rRNA (guanine(2445)-N(2))-methyltransferase RlmL [Phycisphaerales bacterium]|nr:bifunctional 23S rRNA (guanine(2069)-N(7))-methyltransferase RlmK/23S rRNA (guanine(2445)-N(2))-methyltransferase RlmL [Phycisphaerales bacterium]